MEIKQENRSVLRIQKETAAYGTVSRDAIWSVLRPDLRHEILIDGLELLHEDGQQRLDHTAVERLVDERDADVEVDVAVLTEVILKDLVLRVEHVEMVLDALDVLDVDARRDLRADDREDAVVDEDRHRHDLPLRLDARAENRRMELVSKRIRLEEIDVVLLEECLETFPPSSHPLRQQLPSSRSASLPAFRASALSPCSLPCKCASLIRYE